MAAGQDIFQEIPGLLIVSGWYAEQAVASPRIIFCPLPGLLNGDMFWLVAQSGYLFLRNRVLAGCH